MVISRNSKLGRYRQIFGRRECIHGCIQKESTGRGGVVTQRGGGVYLGGGVTNITGYTSFLALIIGLAKKPNTWSTQSESLEKTTVCISK